MTTNPSHQTTQRQKTRREENSNEVSRAPLSAEAEQLLALLLKRDPPAPYHQLAQLLHKPVLRRILSILESSEGAPTQKEWQRIAAWASDILARVDELAYGKGKIEGKKQVFLTLVETYALLSFAQDGVPPEPGMPLFDAAAIAAELTTLKAAEIPIVVGHEDER